jgi:hypothetical protein
MNRLDIKIPKISSFQTYLQINHKLDTKINKYDIRWLKAETFKRGAKYFYFN